MDEDKRNVAQWKGGFCMCWERYKDCLLIMCCYPCGLARLKSDFDQTSMALNLMLTLCSPCYTAIMFRTEIRVGYGIGGRWWQDLFEAFFCPCCSACQLSREVSIRGTVRTEPIVALM